MTCLHCSAATTNGLALCDLSQMQAAKALEFVPIYFRNLARWRPGRAGSRQVPGSRVLWDGEPRDGASDRVSRALDEAGASIIGWARALAADRSLEIPQADDEAASVGIACRLLAENLTSVGTLDWAGAFVNELSGHEEALRLLTMDVAPGWYAGGCTNEVNGQRCDSGTYVVPGLTWVTCRACGVTTYARDHLDTILDEAREWIARPKAIAEAIVALVDAEPSVPQLHDRIRQWSARGRLIVHRKTEVNDFGAEVDTGAKRYRLGDVLDILLMPAKAERHQRSA